VYVIYSIDHIVRLCDKTYQHDLEE